MSSPLPNPGQPAGTEPIASGESPRPGTPAEDAGLLEEVIQETSQALVSEEPLTTAEKRAFEEVALRLRGQPLPLEAIVSELLFAVLNQHISDLPGFEVWGHVLSDRVARTLVDDQTAKSRLESLWNRLQGGQP